MLIVQVSANLSNRRVGQTHAHDRHQVRIERGHAERERADLIQGRFGHHKGRAPDTHSQQRFDDAPTSPQCPLPLSLDYRGRIGL